MRLAWTAYIAWATGWVAGATACWHVWGAGAWYGWVGGYAVVTVPIAVKLSSRTASSDDTEGGRSYR